MTFLGLAGVGDLIVTCASPLSRNYRVGYALGKGQSLDDILEELGQVAEGINTLGLLKVDTVLAGRKTLERVNGTALGTPFQGYEIHMGETTGPDTARPVARMADGRSDGAISADGRIAGSYVHGLLDLAGQRAAWLARIGGTGRGIDQHAAVDRALDEIAALLEIHLDIDALVAMSQMAQD